MDQRVGSRATAYRDGVDLLLSAWVGRAKHVTCAIAEDPEFALAYIARARLHQIYGEVSEARAKAACARTLSANVTQRERQHVAIIADASKGAPASRSQEPSSLEEFPRDALVLSLLLGAFGGYASRGVLTTTPPRSRSASATQRSDEAIQPLVGRAGCFASARNDGWECAESK